MKSALYSYFNKVGEILMVTRSTAEAVAGAVKDGSYAGALAGVYDPEQFYVVDKKAMLRPAMNIFIKGHMLIGVPNGATVSINNIDYDADGSDIEMEFDQPGRKIIDVTLWPFKPWRGTYEN